MTEESNIVFISYAREDFDVAKRLYSDLKSAGLSVWFDKESLLPGSKWKVAIIQAIRKSRYFLALLSDNSVNKTGYVQKELREALDLVDEFPESKIFIIPVRLDACKPTHNKLTEIHYANMFPCWKRGLEEILKAMEIQPKTIESKLRLAHLRRTMGFDTSIDIQNTISEIWNILDNVTIDSERHELQRLLTKAYHQLGISLQNQGLHSRASSKLDKAILLRCFTGDPEVAYSLFQKFFNGRLAYFNGKVGCIDELVPGWRETLVTQLEQSAKVFKDSSEPNHYSNTLHNLAFVHQVLASEKEKERKFYDGNIEFIKANELYETAKFVREQLRDLRMTAYSKVRIAECKLGMARYGLFMGDKGSARKLTFEADKLAQEVKQYYEMIPQETIRIIDLRNIDCEIERLRRETKCN